MAVAGAAAAPRGFVAFCERQPGDCGTTPAELADMRQASGVAPASPAVAAISFDWTNAFAGRPAPHAAPGGHPEPVLQLARYDWSAAFAQVRLGAESAGAQFRPVRQVASSARTPMTSGTWALLSHTNERINRAIAQRADADIYGVGELWATPLSDGRAAGDCEDYVLEKRRALIAAGLPREALSIAVVTTDRGLTHAVLVVATNKGDYVLDSLSAWILPWAKTGYTWKERQVDGSASRWAFAAGEATSLPTEPGLLLASLR